MIPLNLPQQLSVVDSPEIYLVTESGLVKLRTKDALQLAKESGKTLNQINNHEGLPLCKILTFQESRIKKKQTKNEKQLRIPLTIDSHDLLHKFSQTNKYLEQKLIVKFNLTSKKRRKDRENDKVNKQRLIEEIKKYFLGRKVIVTDDNVTISQ